MLNVDTTWKNGNFIITIKNDEEREELQNCIGDDGNIFDYENYEKIELEDHFDDKGSELFIGIAVELMKKNKNNLKMNFVQPSHISDKIF